MKRDNLAVKENKAKRDRMVPVSKGRTDSKDKGESRGKEANKVPKVKTAKEAKKAKGKMAQLVRMARTEKGRQTLAEVVVRVKAV